MTILVNGVGAVTKRGRRRCVTLVSGVEMAAHSIGNPTTRKIVEFLADLGIPTRSEAITERTFFPGMKIAYGVIIFDETKLKHPGDLLHEAGHLAVVSKDERSRMDGDAGPNGGSELSALAWSYAAAVHLGLDPAVVFHKDSYQGGGEAMVENFMAKRFVGVPLLQFYGLTADEKRARELGVSPFPFMLKWMR